MSVRSLRRPGRPLSATGTASRRSPTWPAHSLDRLADLEGAGSVGPGSDGTESVNLRAWARAQGIRPQTAYRWFRPGRPPVPATTRGTLILVGDLDASTTTRSGRTANDARVSSSEQGASLDQQVVRVAMCATEHGHSVEEVVTEVDSELHDHRRKLAGLLRNKNVTTMLAEHRDRLARFGVEHLKAARAAQGRQIVVVDEVDDDLVGDRTEVLTSFSGRLPGEPPLEGEVPVGVRVTECWRRRGMCKQPRSARSGGRKCTRRARSRTSTRSPRSRPAPSLVAGRPSRFPGRSRVASA